ncbi:MAG: phenylacetate--CoA ligase [Oscillospiraceae bacterium]|jgi:phenylacetate-CoA ligase|nr:phenylacetate--CoA ligase [Oscillospiraceae bacterium]
MTIKSTQLDMLRAQLDRLARFDGGFYQAKLGRARLGADDPQSEFETLPFTDKDELRGTYPLGIAAVGEREIIRIHSSSGTTGKPVIIPYTKKDVDDWALMFKRCYEMAGVTSLDRIHVTPGYGLWTAGIGFQLGAELLGAMVIPMGPGNTEKQLMMMADLGSTVLCATSSFALLLAEEIEKRGLRDQIRLTKGVIGSERWGEKMRRRISTELGISLYDIYGLTEIYGPGIGISCDEDAGMHCFDDFVYLEIIDPKTGKNLPDGEYGELVITTLQKEGAPLIRYRTHDLTRILPGTCACGDTNTRIDTLIGRTDDMIKVKGVNIYPGQVEDVLRDVDGVSSEYRVTIDHVDGKDVMTLTFETEPDADKSDVEKYVRTIFKSRVGLTIEPNAVPLGVLPRSEKKTARVLDNRYS